VIRLVRHAWVAALVVAAVGGCSGAATAAPQQTGGGLQTITADGKPRTYLIETPQVSGPAPTVIMLHGLGGAAQGVMKSSGLAGLGGQQGFVAVFPNGINHQWNHFPPDKVPAPFVKRAKGDVPNDVDFLNALLADLIQRGITDPKRVYLAGFSVGGFMAMRLACLEADKFAAIALISSTMTEPESEGCTPDAPLPAVIIKGTADKTVPYDGGEVMPERTFTVWSADQLTAFFTKLDGCTGAAQASQIPGSGGQTIDVSNWSNCANGPVTLYKVNGGEHAIYKLPPPAKTMWAFFRDHSR